MTDSLKFEVLEDVESMTAWWQYALAGAGGVAAGVVVYVAVAAVT